MPARTRHFFLAVALLVVSALACATLTGGDPAATAPPPPAGETLDETAPAPANESPSEQPEQPDTPPTSEPEANESAQEPAPPAPSGSSPDVLDLDDPALFQPLENLNSYNFTWGYTFEGSDENNNPVRGAVTVEAQHASNPLAEWQVMEASGLAADDNLVSFTYVYLEGNEYIYTPEFGCISGAAEFDPPFQLAELQDLFSGQAQRLTPDETVNGVDTYVYALDNNNLKDSEPNENIQELVEGRIYIDKATGAIVRLTAQAIGYSGVLGENETNVFGDLTMEVNVTNLNGPVDIRVPDECEAGATGGDSAYPMTEDAANVASLPGLLTYETGMSAEEVAEFYKTAMADAGWTLTDEISFAGLATQTYAKDGQELSVTIATDDETGVTTVLIVEVQE